MLINSTTANRFYNEFIIWSLIDEHNENAIGEDNKAGIIHTSRGRAIREQIENVLRQNKTDFGRLTPNNLMRVLGQVAPELNGDIQNLNGNFKNYFSEFQAMTGINSNHRDSQGNYILDQNYHYLPISPYDPHFSHLGSVLNNGSHLGGIDANVNVDASNLNRITVASGLNYISNLHPTDEGWYGRNTNTPLFNSEDITGLSQLKLWMTNDEYQKIRQHVANSVDMTHLTRDQVLSYQRMTNKAIFLLRGLRDRGYQYEIQADHRLGQISAVINGTKTRIRIMDTPDQENYIGHIYDRGMTGYYNGSRKNPQTGSYDVPVTPRQALDLVLFALGDRIPLRDRNGNPVKNQQGKVVPVGRDMIRTRIIGRQPVKYHMAYHQSKSGDSGNFSAVTGPYLINGKPDSYGNVVRMIFSTDNRRHSESTKMPTGNDAENYLRTSVQTARDNFVKEVDLEQLIADAKEHKADPDHFPDFNSDPLINTLQENIWSSLTDNTDDSDNSRAVMLKPGVTQEDFFNAINDNPNMTQEELDKYEYSPDLSPEEMAKQFLYDNVDYYVGHFDADIAGKRFDPAMVVRYQDSQYGIYRNKDDMVKALKLANISASELKGNDQNLQNIANALVKFDSASAKPLSSQKSDFMQSVYRTVVTSLADNGVSFKPSDIMIDKNGIIQYKGTMPTHEKMRDRAGRLYEDHEFTGQIGQVFEPKQEGLDKGVIYTKFASGENYAIIPGYEANILPQREGENKTLEERTRLTGYKQHLLQNIKYQLRQDLLLSRDNDHAGDTTSINNTYRELYGDHRDIDFVDLYKEQGMPDRVLKAMIESETQKVRYPNEIRDGSTVNADYRATKYGYDIANDNNLDPYNLTDNRNMSLLTRESDGYFDPIASNATTTNQGIAKFLASGAKIDDKGRIIPGPKTGPGSRTALMNLDEAQYMIYDPFDRQNMTISNWIQADRVTPDVNVAQMTFGGWNQDDGVVISKEFAENYQIRDSTGKIRPLKVGDKITDMNGNKGVINLIVDPDMPKEEIQKQNLEKAVDFFKKNKNVDIVMAPFPAVSRYNGGTARQLMREPHDIVGLDGQIIHNACGKMPMIITDKAADVKTKIYSDEDIKAGKGRKISAQLAWSLDAKNATAIMKEAYGNNNAAMNNLTEYLNVMGLDMDAYGNLNSQINTQKLEKRNLITIPDPVYTDKGNISMKQTLAKFDNQLNKEGGLMELPFDIKLANGQTTNKVPILSSYLRSGQEMVDGQPLVHDYTHQYHNIGYNSVRYLDAKNTLAEFGDNPDLSKMTTSERSRYAKAQKDIDAMQKKTQEAYNAIASDVKKRVFEGKHNIFRDKIMSRKMPNSATSVWTADPRLDIETIGMSPAMAEKLGLKNGDSALIWRDPILRDGGIRYMKVNIDKRLTGISVNPSMDLCFDGDFDGDTLGIVALKSKQAKKEAREKFSVRNNLLDYGSKDPKTGEHPLFMQHSLDIMVAEHKHPEFKERWKNLTSEVNKFEKDYYDAQKDLKKQYEQKLLSKDDYTNKKMALDTQVDLKRSHAAKKISNYYNDCYKDDFGANIKYGNIQEHLQSVKEACLDTGAKGSMSKFIDYTIWLGAKMANGQPVHPDEKGNIDFGQIVDNKKTMSTRDMQIATMKATAIKSFGTGIAGAFSQRGIKALRNVNPKAILELTYPVTQSVLQVKHDPAEAVKKYDMLMGPARQIWNGYSMSKDDNGKWTINCDQNGKPQMATKEEWVNTFIRMYNEDLNVSPNPDYVKDVANALANPDTGRMQSVEDATTISTMDKLAYNGTFDDIVEAAKNHKNIFDGKNNACFAPNKVVENVENARKRIARNKQIEQDLANGKSVTFDPNDKKQIHEFGKSDTANGQTRERIKPTQVVHIPNKPVDKSAYQMPTEPINTGLSGTAMASFDASDSTSLSEPKQSTMPTQATEGITQDGRLDPRKLQADTSDIDDEDDSNHQASIN